MNVTHGLFEQPLPVNIDHPFSCITPSGKGFMTTIIGAIPMDQGIRQEFRATPEPVPADQEAGDD